ncbi:hypothetical protein MJT46_018737 [Ovis ammon polii x Ovis aries]|nr:hypothetical protein MJT46_018737 [Ovis ammon polii x Ovis aries]
MEMQEKAVVTSQRAFVIVFSSDQRTSEIIQSLLEPQAKDAKYTRVFPHETDERKTACVQAFGHSPKNGALLTSVGSEMRSQHPLWSSPWKKEIRSLDKAAMEPPAVKLLLKIQKHSSCEKLILLTYILSFFHLEGRKLKHQQLYRMQFRHQNRDQPALLIVVQKFPGKSSACPSLGSKTYLQKMHRGYKARTQDSIFRSLKIPVENMTILDRREG